MSFSVQRASEGNAYSRMWRTVYPSIVNRVASSVSPLPLKVLSEAVYEEIKDHPAFIANKRILWNLRTYVPRCRWEREPMLMQNHNIENRPLTSLMTTAAGDSSI